MRIHYRVAGTGPPIVLLHGAFESGDEWFQWGYVDALGRDYRLILPDARGNGRSDKPRDPDAYRIERLAADVVAVLDNLRVDRAHCLGYSFGGQLAFALAKCAPNRFRSFLIGGQSPRTRTPEDVERTIKFLRKGKEALIAQIEKLWRPLSPEERAQFLTYDPEALIARALGMSGAEYESALPAISVPCFIWFGAEDPKARGAEDWVKQIPNATLLVLPGLNHETAPLVESVMPQIRRFLRSVEEGESSA